MDREAQDLTPSELPPQLAAVLAALLCAATVTAVAWWWANGPSATPASQAQLSAQPSLFVGWQKPDVALLLSGEAHGYLQPCGCSHPQKGGLARRYNFLESLRKKGWPVVAVDLGNLPQPGQPQSMLKYITAMKALKIMDYTAVTFGELEMRMPLVDALAETALNQLSPPVVTANLDLNRPGDVYVPMVTTCLVGGQGKGPCVGVTALVGPSVEKTIAGKDPTIKFDHQTDQVLRKTLGGLAKQKLDLVVLLYQGTQKEASRCAEFCAREQATNPTFPRVDVILCLDVADEPSGVARQVGNSMIVSVGHKGRYVGVVGAYRTNKPGQPWALRYQLVPMGEELETPRGLQNPVNVLMEDYAATVKKDLYLAKYPRKKHPVQLQFPTSEYVGSERCADCHEHAFNVWSNKKSKHHAHAYDSLVKAQRPSNRQFDGECVVCHTVGFGYESGFNSARALQKKVPLEGVGCESCHGPGSAHAKNPNNRELRALMNPWKAEPNLKKRLNLIDRTCVQCHDIDNDVHWNFEKNWPKIAHPTPKKK